MKLTDENRIAMYRLKKEGYSHKKLSKKFKIAHTNVRYMIKLADLHGETVLIKKKNNYYPPDVNVNLNMSKKFKIKMYILFICLLEKIF